MCRFLAYIGKPLFMSELVSKSSHSLIAQAMTAREAKTEVNADGCGLGWYGDRPTPGTYRSVLPAWSDPNLLTLADQLCSGLFMAHVRSATTGEVSYANCHPFVSNNHMFMHNGMITDYKKIRSHIERLISDELYENVVGSTDSESLFHAALSRGLEQDPVGAMNDVLNTAAQIQAERISCGRVRFAAIHSDGEKIWAFRWASDHKPPTLYYHCVENGTVIASEPLDNEDHWTEVPDNSVAIFGKNGFEELRMLD